jgi:glycosyltransferase involved in cell wall biosynthesis
MPSPVAFIIPTLNEEATIGPVLDALQAVLPAAGLCQAEFLVVDNNSTDATARIATGRGARVINEPRRGYGQACLSGIAALSTEAQILVFLDADGSDDPQDLPRLLAPLFEGSFDFVLGSRTIAARLSSAFTPPQAFGNWLATNLMRLFFGTHYSDLGPFRAICRQSLDRLCMSDINYGWTIEMQIKAHRLGLRVLEIPVNYRKRLAGQSKISGHLLGSIRAGYKILWCIAKYALSPQKNLSAKLK